MCRDKSRGQRTTLHSYYVSPRDETHILSGSKHLYLLSQLLQTSKSGFLFFIVLFFVLRRGLAMYLSGLLFALCGLCWPQTHGNLPA